jgi:transcription elongation factor
MATFSAKAAIAPPSAKTIVGVVSVPQGIATPPVAGSPSASASSAIQSGYREPGFPGLYTHALSSGCWSPDGKSLWLTSLGGARHAVWRVNTHASDEMDAAAADTKLGCGSVTREWDACGALPQFPPPANEVQYSSVAIVSLLHVFRACAASFGACG